MEKAISSEAAEVRAKYVKLLTLPITGGLAGAIDSVLPPGFSLPLGAKIGLYVAVALGALAVAFLWYRSRLLVLEELKRFAFERSFVAGELLSYLRSFTGSLFASEVPRGHEQVPLMISVSWVALSLYFAESYGVEELLSRLQGLITALSAQLAQMLDALEGSPIYQGLPEEARRPFELLRERLSGS